VAKGEKVGERNAASEKPEKTQLGGCFSKLNVAGDKGVGIKRVGRSGMNKKSD